MLSRVAEKLAQLIRKEDVVARYGGEEFVALLRLADEASAKICAERCRAGIEALSIVVAQHKITTTVSIGAVTLLPGKTATSDQLIAKADANLYEAKSQGRNRVVSSLSP